MFFLNFSFTLFTCCNANQWWTIKLSNMNDSLWKELSVCLIKERHSLMRAEQLKDSTSVDQINPAQLELLQPRCRQEDYHKSYETRSQCSCSSKASKLLKQSSKSAINLPAVEACAKAKATCARAKANVFEAAMDLGNMEQLPGVGDTD